MSNLSDFIGADPQGIVKMNASAAFTAGDVMVNNDTGKPTVLSTALGLAFETNTTAGPVAIRAAADVEAANQANYGNSQNAARTICLLGNGNFAAVYSGNGTTATTNINVRIRTPLGADVCPVIVPTTAASCASYRIFKLNSTQLVVAWVETGANLKFAIVNNDGTVAVAATLVSVINSTSLDQWNMAATASGNMVFAYAKVTSSNLNFSRFNSGGVLQGAETVVDSASSPNGVAVLGCSGGHFVISYSRGSATAGYKFARYDASGVLQGSVVTVFASSGALTKCDYSNGLAELSNGNIAIAYYSTGGYPDIAIYNSSNALVKTIDLGDSAAYVAAGAVPCITPIDTGGFAVMHLGGSSGYTRFARFDNGGNSIVGPITFSAAAQSDSASGSGISAVQLGTFGFAVFRCSVNAGTNSDTRLIVIDMNGVVKGSEVVLAASSAQVYGCGFAGSSSGVAVLWDRDAATYVTDAYYNVVRKSVLGVAQNSGAADAQVLVATKGSYTINQSVGAGGVFDGRAAAVPGTRGMVAGNSAVLFGLQP